MKTRSNLQGPRGFTFIEVLAAMIFMAILVPVAMEGIMLSNTVQERASRKRIAGELADRILTDAVVTQSWRNGDQTGDFGDDFPGYTWKVTSQSWPQDTMQLVTAQVTYSVQGRQFTETLSTLANTLTDSGTGSSLTGTGTSLSGTGSNP